MYVPLRRIPLKYLVIVGFFISLIPLGIFVWQSTAIQNNVNDAWQKLTDNSIESVRIAVELESLLVEIERSTKQYLVLQTASISALANDNITRYQHRLAMFSRASPDFLSQLSDKQQSNLQRLQQNYKKINAQELNSLLTVLSNNQSAIMDNLWQHIDKMKALQISLGQKKQKQVMLWLLIVSFLTFLLLMVLSSQVARPVNTLKNKIGMLGKDKKAVLTQPIAFNGPKELLEINVQLDRLALRLTKLEMLRQSFLRHASHEFKTPLASIMESCAILKDQISGPLTPVQKEVVGILEDCTQSLKHLTEQLLDYNYLLQHSKPIIIKQAVLPLIEAASKRYQQFFNKRQQTLAIECELTELATDATLFTRVIDNLLSNAQAYGFKNGHVLVKLYFDKTVNEIVLLVANTGPKVPLEQQGHILEPFGRSEVPRYDSLSGTGLGLSIVNDCVQLLNGKLAFVDLPDYDFAIKITFNEGTL